VARHDQKGRNLSTGTLFAGTSDTYTALDMCQEPAMRTEAGKFYPPGILHVVEFKDLIPNTEYDYQVGVISLSDNDENKHHNRHDDDDKIVWSDVHSFTSAPLVGDTDPFSIIVYGDQGCPSDGWANGEELVTAMVQREIISGDKNKNIRSVHHFGDISYAQGAAHVWDAWHRMIAPFSVSIPLMVGVGNHVSPCCYLNLTCCFAIYLLTD
jgi:hypothetical protein